MFHLASSRFSFLKFIAVVLVYKGFLAVLTTRKVFDTVNMLFLLTTAASVFLAAVYGHNFYRHFLQKRESDTKYQELVEEESENKE